MLLEDFKKLGLENERLKKNPKGKVCNPSKRIKLERDKKTKKLQKKRIFEKTSVRSLEVG